MKRIASALVVLTWSFQLAGCASPPSPPAGLLARPQGKQSPAANNPSTSPAPAAATAVTGKGASATVKALRANLRYHPSGSGAVVREVGKGDALALVDAAPLGPWYKVRHRTSGAEGWIHGNAIVITEAAGGVAAAAAGSREGGGKAPSGKAGAAPSPTSSGRSYINVDGERVPSPVFSDSAPAGASARCRDGSYSFSRNRRGTCSHHGGVARWL